MSAADHPSQAPSVPLGDTVAQSPSPAASFEERGPANLPEIAGHDLLEQVGKGGMGVVYRARQRSLGRIVALKLILHGQHAEPSERARFLIEARAIARLDHPNIVRIHEVGEHEGCPYFSMEYLGGGSLADRLKQGRFPPRQAAQLVIQLARGVQHAHDAGVVHRDLKPANVLLSCPGASSELSITQGSQPPANGEGAQAFRPDLSLKIADFGLARILGEDGNTASQALLGTPSYMSPEQARGKVREVGPASDIHALGAILYRCLTDRPPFQGPTPMDTLMQVLHEDPISPRACNPAVPRDLDTICLKCLEKEPGRRYGSAEALAADLERFLRNEPVSVRPVGPFARSWRWCVRNPVLAALFLTLLVSSVVSTFLAGLAFSLSSAANERTRDALTAREESLRQTRRASTQLDRAEQLLYTSGISRAHKEWQAGNLSAAREYLDGCRWDLRGWEHHYLHTLFTSKYRQFHGHTSWVNRVVCDRTGRFLVSVGKDGMARLWDRSQGKLLRTYQISSANVEGLALTRQGTQFLTGDGLGKISLRAVDSGRILWSVQAHKTPVRTLALAADESWLATGSDEPVIMIWNVQDGKLLHTLTGHAKEITCLAIRDQDRRLISGSKDGTVNVWEVATGKRDRTLAAGPSAVTAISFDAKSEELVVGRLSGEIQIWARGAEKPRLVWMAHPGMVLALCHHPTENTLLTGGGLDGQVCLWDSRNGGLLTKLLGHTSLVSSACWAPDGKEMITGSWDGMVLAWPWPVQQGPVLLPGQNSGLFSIAVSDDERWLAKCTSDRVVRIVDLKTHKIVFTLPHQEQVQRVCFHPGGDLVACSCANGSIHLWRLGGAAPAQVLTGHKKPVSGIRFVANGSQLLTASWDGTLCLWDVASGRCLWTEQFEQNVLRDMDLSPDETLVAIALSDGHVQVLELSTRRRIANWLANRRQVHLLRFSPTGSILATTGLDNIVRFWEPTTGKPLRALPAQTSPLTAMAFSKNGERLFSAGLDRIVRVWNVRTGTETLTLAGMPLAILSLAVLPRTGGLALGCQEGSIQLHEIGSRPAPRLLTTPENHLSSLSVDPASGMVLTSSHNGGLRLWNPRRGSEEVTLCSGGPSLLLATFLGKNVVASDDLGGLACWNVDGKELWEHSLGSRAIQALCAAPGGKSLFVLDAAGQIQSRDATSGHLLASLGQQAPNSPVLACSDDGQWLATADKEGCIQIRKSTTGGIERVLKGHKGEVTCLHFAGNNELLSGGNDGMVCSWDVHSGVRLKVLTAHEGPVRCLLLGARGIVYSAGEDRAVRVWDQELGKELDPFWGHTARIIGLALSPDGKSLYSGSRDRTVRAWDVSGLVTRKLASPP